MRGLVAGFLTFLFYFVFQATVFHFWKVSRRAVALVLLWLVCLPLYVLCYVMLPDDSALWPPPLAAPSDAVTFFSGFLLYFFIFMGYAQFFYMAESSVGVRTMIELTANSERGLSMQELTRTYRYDWMLDRRMKRMIHAGYLTEQDGWYRTTTRGRLVASVLAGCKRLLALGPGG